jgi:hypothetical protein
LTSPEDDFFDKIAAHCVTAALRRSNGYLIPVVRGTGVKFSRQLHSPGFGDEECRRQKVEEIQ